MKLIEFIDRFPDERSCRVHFKEARIQQGITCKKCGGLEHYWLQRKEQFQCKKCKFRTTLRSGTVMECSNLPFRQWYICLHLMTSTKKSISACEMQRQLGRKRYQPGWEMMHKIRIMMGHCSEKKVITEFLRISKNLLAPYNKVSGSANNRKSPYVLFSLDPQSQKIQMLDRTPKCEEHVRTYNTITPFANSFIRSADACEAKGKVQPWMHHIINNSKKILCGIHHAVSEIFFQSYLDEYCFKFNHRNQMSDLFHSALLVAVYKSWKC